MSFSQENKKQSNREADSVVKKIINTEVVYKVEQYKVPGKFYQGFSTPLLGHGAPLS